MFEFNNSCLSSKRKLEINLSNLKNNIKEVKNIILDDVEIIAVLKASAYGNGAEILLNTIKNEGINNFAVAIPQEGEKLRKFWPKRWRFCCR